MLVMQRGRSAILTPLREAQAPTELSEDDVYWPQHRSSHAFHLDGDGIYYVCKEGKVCADHRVSSHTSIDACKGASSLALWLTDGSCTPGGIGHYLAIEFAEKGTQRLEQIRSTETSNR